MSKHDREECTTGFSPPLKSTKSDYDDAPRGLSTSNAAPATNGTSGGSFLKASANVMSKRKVIMRATPLPKSQTSHTPTAATAATNTGIFSPPEGKVVEQELLAGIKDDINGSMTIQFQRLVKLRKQEKEGTPIPESERLKERGSGMITFTEDGTVTAYNHGKKQTTLNFQFPSIEGDAWGVIIGKPERATTKPTLLVMAKDHALIAEGETRAFYLVFDDHNDLLRVINFVLVFYKKKKISTASAADPQLDDNTASSNEGSDSVESESTGDLNNSFASADSELSLLEESQDIFQQNNLLTNSAIKKESPASSLGSPHVRRPAWGL